jgi:hypothetical protein
MNNLKGFPLEMQGSSKRLATFSARALEIQNELMKLMEEPDNVPKEKSAELLESLSGVMHAMAENSVIFAEHCSGLASAIRKGEEYS